MHQECESSRSPTDDGVQLSTMRRSLDIFASLMVHVGPLGTAMAGFSGVDMENLDDIEKFFRALNSKSISRMASAEQLQEAAKGIEPLGKAIKTFSGIDMDALTGGWGEDNLGKFFAGVG